MKKYFIIIPLCSLLLMGAGCGSKNAAKNGTAKDPANMHMHLALPPGFPNDILIYPHGNTYIADIQGETYTVKQATTDKKQDVILWFMAGYYKQQTELTSRKDEGEAVTITLEGNFLYTLHIEPSPSGSSLLITQTREPLPITR